MPKKNKEIKYLNLCMDKKLHEEFEKFCQQFGMSKTGAVEVAIRKYMNEINKENKEDKEN